MFAPRKSSFARRQSQRGISFFGLVFFGGILACLGLVAAQAFPTYLEYHAIGKAAKKAALAGGTPPEVRAAFDRAGAIDDFKAITGKDLDISKQGDKVVVAYAYNKEIHLAGPVHLVIKYVGASNQ